MANGVILGIAVLCGIVFLAAGFIGRSGFYRAVPAGLGILMLVCLWLPATARISLAGHFLGSNFPA